LAARHPLRVFLVLVLGVGWPILAVPVLANRGLIGGPQVPAEFFALAVTWLVMLPAACWVTGATGGRRAVRDLLGRTVRWRVRPRPGRRSLLEKTGGKRRPPAP
jgi:hypothetical protein